MKQFALFLFAVLLAGYSFSQNSFKLNKGSVLTYEVEENGKAYKLDVTIESLTPFKISYKSTDGTLKGFVTVGGNNKQQYYKYDYFVQGNGGSGALLLLPDYMYKSIYQLEQNYRAGIMEDTTSIPIKFSDNTTVPFGKIGFQAEDIEANSNNLELHTYAIDEMGVDFAEGFIMRVNIDPNTPVVTYLNDVKGKLSIHLIAAKGVEVYEYIR